VICPHGAYLLLLDYWGLGVRVTLLGTGFQGIPYLMYMLGGDFAEDQADRLRDADAAGLHGAGTGTGNVC
jgi:hypothetical protein